METRIEGIKLEIQEVEAELKKERTEERRKGKENAESAMSGLGEEEDWTVNERGEVNENFSFSEFTELRQSNRYRSSTKMGYLYLISEKIYLMNQHLNQSHRLRKDLRKRRRRNQ